MAKVACFCGRCFSFESGAATCPGCGEIASLVPEHTGPSRPKVSIQVVNWIGQNGQTQERCPGHAEARALDDRPAGLIVTALASLAADRYPTVR